MNQNQGISTRERILTVAARLFTERGYTGTTVRDIAAELGIANPSLYYHFKSKGDLLVALLSEPLKRVEVAVAEAAELSGDARGRRLITGFLEALEVHGGIMLIVSQADQAIPKPQREIVMEMQPYLMDLLKGVGAEDNRELRIAMAVGAVEGIVATISRTTTGNDEFVRRFREEREFIIDILLGILR
jgi:AcrR family transcriptional regulator